MSTYPFIPATISSQFDHIGKERIHMAPVSMVKRNLLLPPIYFFAGEGWFASLLDVLPGYDVNEDINVLNADGEQIGVLTQLGGDYDYNYLGPAVLYFDTSEFDSHHPDPGDKITLAQKSWSYTGRVSFDYPNVVLAYVPQDFDSDADEKSDLEMSFLYLDDDQTVTITYNGSDYVVGHEPDPETYRIVYHDGYFPLDVNGEPVSVYSSETEETYSARMWSGYMYPSLHTNNSGDDNSSADIYSNRYGFDPDTTSSFTVTRDDESHVFTKTTGSRFVCDEQQTEQFYADRSNPWLMEWTGGSVLVVWSNEP